MNNTRIGLFVCLLCCSAGLAGAGDEALWLEANRPPIPGFEGLPPGGGGCKGLCTSGDNPTCGGRPATIYVDDTGRIQGGALHGQPYRNVLIGTGEADVIVGTDGRDLILARSNDDLICGRGANDYLLGGVGDDGIDGGEGQDQVRGGIGDDRCSPDSEIVFSCETIEPLIEQPSFNYYVDPADPRLLRIEEVDGTVTEYFGERAPSGEALRLTSVRTIQPDGAETWTFVDEQGRPTRILPDSGFTFDFQWTSETQFVVSVVTPGGEGQANVSLDLNDLPDADTTEDAALPAPFVGPMRSGAGPELPSSAVDLDAIEQQIVSAAGSAAVDVSVQRCGAAENNANVAVFIDSNGFAATRVGDGLYRVNLPTQNVDPSAFGEICSSITGLINNSCVFFDNLPVAAIPAVCAQVAAPFLATPIPGVDEAVVLGACSTAIGAGKAYCAIFGASPAPGAPSVSDLVCSTLDAAIDWVLEPEVSLVARAQIPGEGTSLSPSVDAPAGGPFPNLSIDAGGEVDIAAFTSSPVDPAPLQGYVATAQIVCAAPGTSVTLSIVGTDGYSDATTCTVSGDDSCSLSVPGAVEGVVDTVTVSVSGGPSRQITLVF